MKIEYPRLVAIETTNRCNARCKFCPNNSLARNRQVMDEALFKKIIDDCKEFSLPAIEPFLQGEPFVDPNILERLAYINDELPNTKLRLYSNGAALTKQKSDALRELRVDKLYISLNTIDKEKYEDIVGLSFERTMQNIRTLCAASPKGPVAKTITLRLTLVDDTTEDELIRFKELCRELGVNHMAVGLFNYKGDIASTLPVPDFPCEHIDRLDILVNGKTTLCCMDQEGEYGWGNVVEQSVLEVFNSPEARYVRDMQRSGQRDKLVPCNSCNLFWPSFKHMGPIRKLRHVLSYAKYYTKYQPLVLPSKRLRKL
ncbi:MAG: radical SAM/SPASM domain-containing protein [Bradymonadales bacterium]|jgi:MoaA/NifB/PqqE/SkfB family radical SAM enzyme